MSVSFYKEKYTTWTIVVPHASSTMCFVGSICFRYLTFSTPSAAQKLSKENRWLFVQNRASLSRFSSSFSSIVRYQDFRECSRLCISLQRKCISNYNSTLKSARNCEFLFLTFKFFLLKQSGILFKLSHSFFFFALYIFITHDRVFFSYLLC